MMYPHARRCDSDDQNSPSIAARLLRSADAANYLSISERTLWSLKTSGAIRSVQIGRSVRYDIRDLDGWIDEQRSEGQP